MHFFVSKKEIHLGSEGSAGQRLLGSINIPVLSRSLVLLITSGLSKNQLSRVSSLTWFFDFVRSLIKGQNLFFDFLRTTRQGSEPDL